MSEKLITVTKKQFQDWFEAQPDDRLFYEKGPSESCPVSLFAIDKGIGTVSASGYIYRDENSDAITPYKRWLHRVQQDCDSHSYAPHEYRPVPMKDLRHIIKAALR